MIWGECSLTKGTCEQGKALRFTDSPWLNLHIYSMKKQTWFWHVILRKVQLLDSTRVSDYYDLKPDFGVSWVNHPFFEGGANSYWTCSKIFPSRLAAKTLRRRHRNFRHLWFSKSKSRSAWHHRFRDQTNHHFPNWSIHSRQISWRWPMGPSTYGGCSIILGREEARFSWQKEEGVSCWGQGLASRIFLILVMLVLFFTKLGTDGAKGGGCWTIDLFRATVLCTDCWKVWAFVTSTSWYGQQPICRAEIPTDWESVFQPSTGYG